MLPSLPTGLGPVSRENNPWPTLPSTPHSQHPYLPQDLSTGHANPLIWTQEVPGLRLDPPRAGCRVSWVPFCEALRDVLVVTWYWRSHRASCYICSGGPCSFKMWKQPEPRRSELRPTLSPWASQLCHPTSLRKDRQRQLGAAALCPALS